MPSITPDATVCAANPWAGVSEKMLIQTLQTLEADRLVRRDALPVVPPHVEYSLTDDGHRAVELLAPLVQWAQHQVRR